MSRPWLAVETSTPTGGIAVGDADSLLTEVVLGNQARHSLAIVPAVEFALRHAEVERSQIGGVIVGAGPGSFTGVRVAAATGKGIARALGVPLYAASSLAALALWTEPSDRPVCPLFDARRGEVYAACYRIRNGRMEVLEQPRVCAIEVAAAIATEHGALCIGEGAWAHAAELARRGLRPAATRHASPRAAALLRLLDIEGGTTAIESPSWEPLYLRASGAERERT